MGEDTGAVPGMSVGEQLAAGQDYYSKVGEGPDAPPPGLYTFQLVSVEFKHKKADGELLIMWTHVVMEGEHKGEQMNDFSKPTSQKGYPIRLMRQRINRLGWSAPDDLRELEQIIPEIDAAGPIYKGLVEHSKGSNDQMFANVEVKDLIDQYGARTSGQRAAPAAGDGAVGESAPAPAIQTTIKPNDSVTFACDGTSYSGIVFSVDAAGIAVTVDGETDTFVFDDPSDLTLVPVPAEDSSVPTQDAAAATPAGSEIDDLIAFAIALGYDVPEGTTQKDLVDVLKINETFDAESITEDERLMLVRANIPVRPKPAPAKPTKPTKPKKPTKPSKSAKPTKKPTRRK